MCELCVPNLEELGFRPIHVVLNDAAALQKLRTEQKSEQNVIVPAVTPALP